MVEEGGEAYGSCYPEPKKWQVKQGKFNSIILSAVKMN